MLPSLAFYCVLSLSAAPADVAVVCPDEFRPALAPWIAHREGQGRKVELLSSAGSADDVRSRIRTVGHGGKLRFVVLVGDADPAAPRDARVARRCVPTHHAASKVVVKWGSEPQLAADTWYADLDDDAKPDVAIGRLTCDTSAELATIVKKIIAYEQSADMGVWRRRINFVAGVGGFGALADSVIESGAKMVITDGIPSAYATSMTYGSWQSPYCPAPSQFHEATLDRINEGSLFWIYIGHGQRRWLDAIQVPGKQYGILSTNDMSKMRAISGAPIALFLACYTGAFDEAGDCMAEEMLRTEGAPIAAICGSRVTMPYAMSVMGTEMMQECFVRRRETVGEIVLHAKRSMLDDKGTAPNRQTLDAIATLVSPKGIKPADERAEHVLLFNLIGDPLLRIPHPAELKLQAPKSATAGETIEVSGVCEVNGKCTLELVVPRDRLRFTPPARAKYDESPETAAAYDRVYRQANNPLVATTSIGTEDGRFRARLAVPADLDGPCHVRAFLQGDKQAAIGASDIYIRRVRSASRQANNAAPMAGGK